jgi:hypothetical protein
LRALVNNMGMASGPQVVINTDQVDPSDNADQLYPWKRWHVTSDPMGDNRPPITFFQPQSNVTELLGVYNAINNDADDKSAIPKYVTGESLSGGAGRTASGLSMLMGNSSKVLQTVAANVDGDVMEPALTDLYDMIMLTDTSGLLSGTEQIEVNGVVVALQKETERQKQLQFLQITANPIDSPIVGQLGRARVLRSVASNMGLPDDIVPDDDTIQAEMQAAKQAAAANGGSNPEAELNNAKIENLRATALANLAKTGVTPDALLLLDHIMSRSPPPGSAPAQPGANPAAQAQGSQAPSAAPTQHSDNAPPMNSFQPVSNHGALR